jgi:hypothetical protein
MSNITILGGDISKGRWSVSTVFDNFTMMVNGIPFDMRSEVDTVEIMTEDKVKKFAGSVGLGLVGGIALGPLGAIGGLLAGGNKKEVCFVCTLKSGQKFIGKTDGKTFQKLMTLSFNK